LKLMAWTKAQTVIVASAVVLLTAGTTVVTVKEMAAQGHEAWQEKYDLSVLGSLPPEVKILPSLPSTVQSQLHVMGIDPRTGKALGLGQSVPDLLMAVNGVKSAQLILNAPMPEGKYDIIATMPNASENTMAAREEIKKTFGLTSRREMIETNVLILTVASREAAGLRPASGQLSGDEELNSYSAHRQSIYPLVDYLEHCLGTVIIDQTGLKGKFDIDFKWDSTPEGLKQVLLDQLGLKLEPSQQAVEFVVVEKAN